LNIKIDNTLGENSWEQQKFKDRFGEREQETGLRCRLVAAHQAELAALNARIAALEARLDKDSHTHPRLHLDHAQTRFLHPGRVDRRSCRSAADAAATGLNCYKK
jgi:hypothetical protein